ncbi:hypothetical protein PVK06_011183 [Gossypium arboreum]|uniref:Uncharacterized protein n=1 Tax=Gossypium arboreum TaxID=29729 RepID=A0ABR0Q861_GOSAR|nr:hypothetical protein PVK06_011183 [Gossypium arboreum]
MRPFKSKDNGWKGEPINNTHAITNPNRASDDAYTIAPSDYARCAIVTEGTTRGTIGELNSFLIPIALWDLSRLHSFYMGDANTSAIFVLSRWVIFPTLTTRS